VCVCVCVCVNSSTYVLFGVVLLFLPLPPLSQAKNGDNAKKDGMSPAQRKER